MIVAMSEPAFHSDRFRVVEEIARGGMGIVYRVVDSASEQELALKVLRPELVDDDRNCAALFEREYHTLASITHPRIVRVHEYGFHERRPYYTMELLEGRDLRELSPMPYQQACASLRDVATSLALLHARGLLHRDISARNVWRTRDGRCKVLDFGSLSAFGAQEDIVGTAPFVSPEALDGAKLDQRTDLYALGALAYWLLTGKHAFPANHLHELHPLWLRRPEPPSKFVKGIPLELDYLVLSLLSREPFARPASAAEVIDRLTLIAGLLRDDDAELEAQAQAFLTSPRLVGRAEQLNLIGSLLTRAEAGQGGALLIEGSAGMGRSRLLAEVVTRGQLAGAAVSRVSAEASREPLTTARALARQLFATLPTEATHAAGVHTDILANLDARLGEALRGSAPFSQPEQTVTRERAQVALSEWVTKLAQSHFLVLAVDDIHLADEASVAWLAGLAEDAGSHRLLVVTTSRTARMAESVGRALSSRSEHVHLEPLRSRDTADLLRAIFGHGPSLARCAEWLHAASAGSPLYCIELVRALLAANVIRYADGVWMLPIVRPDIPLPTGLAEALAERCSRLSTVARQLAEGISVQPRGLSSHRCEELAVRMGISGVHALLTELVQEGVLVEEADCFRVSSGALRDALLSGTSTAHKQRLHRRHAEMLLAGGAHRDPFTVLEAAHQLMLAGEPARGAELVSEVGEKDAFNATGDYHHLWTPMVAESLRMDRAHGRSIYVQIPKLAFLCSAAYTADFHLASEFGEMAIAAFDRVTGMGAARKLRPWLGGKLSFAVGIVVGLVRFAIHKPRNLKYEFGMLIPWFINSVTALCGMATILLDLEAVRRYAKLLEVFEGFAERWAPVGSLRFCQGLEMTLLDDHARSVACWSTLASNFEDATCYSDLPDIARSEYLGGAWFLRGVSEGYKANDDVLLCAEKLEATGLALHRIMAKQLLAAYHANRGEITQSALYQQHVELHAIQFGSAWQVEVWGPTTMSIVHVCMSDVMGLKRMSDRLQVLSRDIPSLTRHATLVRAGYQLVLGDVESSAAGYASVLDDLGPEPFHGSMAYHAFWAAALNLLGRHAEAKAVCERPRRRQDASHTAFAMLTTWVDIEWAVASIGLGDPQAATARLDACLTAAEGESSPLIRGSLHHARARTALALGSEASFTHHQAETLRWFSQTRAEVLMSRYEQLAALALTAPWSMGGEAGSDEMTRRLSESASAEDGAKQALAALLKMSGSTSGVLVRLRGEHLDAVATTGVDQLPALISEHIRELAADYTAEVATETLSTYFEKRADSGGSDAAVAGFHTLLLVTHMDDGLIAVGAVAVAQSASYHPPSYAGLEAVARYLHSTSSVAS